MTKQTVKHATYKPGDRQVEALFAPNSKTAQRNKLKEYSEGPIEVQPGKMSTDWEFLKFKDNLSVALTKALPATVDDEGRVSGNGVRANFYGLRYVGGYPQIPATYPLVDNSFLREKEGLKNSWQSPWHEVCARALVRLFFRDIKPVPLKIRVNSSSMMPFYTKDIGEKLELVRYALENGRKSGEMMMKGDYITPWVNYYIGGAYHTVYRRQATDAMTFENGKFTAKPRPVADLTFALTGGREGTFSPSDRTLHIEGVKIPDGFARERNRTAMGGPLGLNANLMVIAQAVRAHIYEEFAYTYHHTTRSSQEKEMQQMGHIIAADVSNHDWFWATFVVDTVADELLSLGYAEWWVELFKVRFKLPNYVTDVSPTEGNILLGDWTQPSNNGGLPSGNAFTDLDGTFLMTLVYFIIQVEHTYPELIPALGSVDKAEGVLNSYLRGKQPIALKDKSDDALLGWPDEYLHGRAKALHEKMKKGDQISPYMKVSYEHGGAFLGSILLYPTSKETTGLVLIGNVNSQVGNQFSPEYGVQSGIRDRSKARRPYGGLAWKTMSQSYGSSPAYTTVVDITEYEYARVYGESYRAYREQWMLSDEQKLRDDLLARKLKMPDLTMIEIEVLQDPSKLEWKYTPGDVSSSITDLMFNGLPLEEIEPYFKDIYPHG